MIPPNKATAGISAALPLPRGGSLARAQRLLELAQWNATIETFMVVKLELGPNSQKLSEVKEVRWGRLGRGQSR